MDTILPILEKSMHPLYLFEGSSRLCLYSKLRNGKANTSDGVSEATEESLKHVCSIASIMARFDKGFPNEKHLLYFEEYRNPNTGFKKEILYVEKMKLYKNLVKKGINRNGVAYMKKPKVSGGRR